MMPGQHGRLPLRTVAGTAFILAGACVALWALTHPWGVLGGGDTGRSGRWIVSHTFHFLGAVLGLTGLMGFVHREVNSAGLMERTGFGIAFAGTILFAATGVFTAFFWPVLATHAPHLVAVDGPFLSPPHPVTVASRVLYSVGHAAFAVALMRERAIGRGGGVALVTGALLLMIPTEPLSMLPWLLFPLGGTLFGIGLAALGIAVRRQGSALI